MYVCMYVHVCMRVDMCLSSYKGDQGVRSAYNALSSDQAQMGSQVRLQRWAPATHLKLGAVLMPTNLFECWIKSGRNRPANPGGGSNRCHR
jgi:hypothetical protein